MTFAAPKLSGGWQGVGFKYSGGNASTVKIDDIYIGNTYQDVTPLTYLDFPEPVFDSFDNYTADASVDGQGMTADGWAGPWTRLSGGDVNVVSGGITNEALSVETTGNALLLDASVGISRYKRGLSEPFLDNGRTYWFGFQAEFSDAGEDGGELVVMLVDNDEEEFGGGGPNGQFLAIGKTITPSTLGIMTFGPFNNAETTEVAADGPLWLVAKIETNGTPAPDLVRLFVNPTPGTEPANGTEVVSFAAPELNGGWQGVGFKFSGGATTAKIDDIYLGYRFEDVTPENY